jgi:hypothetical protein
MYLGEDMEVNRSDDHFEKVISDAEERNLTKIIQKDLNNDKNPKLELTFKDNMNRLTYQSPVMPDSILNEFNKQGSEKKINEDTNTIGSRILNIINNNSNLNTLTNKDTLTQNTLSNDSNSETNNRLSISSGSNSTLKSNVQMSNTSSELQKTIKNFEDAIKGDKFNSDNIDDKIRQILKKDLASDSDLETSLNYSSDDNDTKYQEIFSNSNVVNGDNDQKIKDKKKFFNNYMHF